jgi:hypothetical protein|tara:strand:+ start:3637 stop:5805 length:2169 start_codon:yes stop_codon:yes gene_type:complete
MSGPSWTTDGGSGSGPSWTQQETPEVQVPEGFKLVEQYDDGSYVASNEDSGQLTFVDPSGYTTTNLSQITEIMNSKEGSKRAGDIVKGETAQEIAGEIPTRATSAFEFFPFLRSYVDRGGALARSYNTGVPYETALDTIQTAVDRRTQEAPITSTASRLGTSIVGAAPFVPALSSSSLLGQIGQGATYGGILGGAESAVSGLPELVNTGDFSDYVAGVKAGTSSGTLFGGAGVPVSKGVGFLFNKYLQQPISDIVEKIGFKKDAGKVVEDFLAMDAADAVESAQTSGPYGSISTLGPNTSALLDVVVNSPSSGARIAKENITDTSIVAANDLDDVLTQLLGPISRGIKTQKAEIMSDTAKARRELYGDAYDFSINSADEGGQAVIDLLGRVDPTDLSGAKTLLREAGEAIDFDNPSVATIDYITRQLYSRGEALRRAGEDAASQSKFNLARLLRNSLDEINPSYKAARAAGKDAIDQKLAAQLGNDILSPRITREDVTIALETVDEVGLKQLRQALRNRIDEIAANARVNPRGDNEAIVIENLAILKSLNTRAVKEKMAMVLGDRAMETLSEQINNTSSALMQAAMVNANSKTAIRGLVMERMKQIVGQNLSETVGQQGVASTAASSLLDSVSGPNQATRIQEVSSEIAPILTQRMAPEQLRKQAELMEALVPAIERARQGSRAATSGTQKLATSMGLNPENKDRDARTQMLLNQFGLGAFR